MTVTLQYTVVASDVKIEAQLSNHTFATDDVENRILEAERAVNSYTGKSLLNPWLYTDNDYPDAMLAIRQLAAGKLLQRFSNKSVQAKAKIDEAFDTLKHMLHLSTDKGASGKEESEGSVIVINGECDADDIAWMKRRASWYDDSVSGDFVPATGPSSPGHFIA